jgi:hypothetical protein
MVVLLVSILEIGRLLPEWPVSSISAGDHTGAALNPI